MPTIVRYTSQSEEGGWIPVVRRVYTCAEAQAGTRLLRGCFESHRSVESAAEAKDRRVSRYG